MIAVTPTVKAAGWSHGVIPQKLIGSVEALPKTIPSSAPAPTKSYCRVGFCRCRTTRNQTAFRKIRLNLRNTCLNVLHDKEEALCLFMRREPRPAGDCRSNNGLRSPDAVT